MRARRLSLPLARITRLEGNSTRARTVRKCGAENLGQRVLLRDCNALEVALALVIAHIARGCERLLDDTQQDDVTA